MAAGDAVQVVLSWQTGAGQGYYKNITHAVLTTTTEVDQPFALAVATVFSDAFTMTGWQAVSGAVMLSVEVKNITEADAPTFAGPINQAGTDGGVLLPAQIALVTSLRSTLGSRRGRGRVFNAGFTEVGNVAFGAPAASLVSALADGWNRVLAHYSDAGAELAVFSRLDNIARQVVGVAVDPVWDTQRKRIR